jgi:hypothetical protein
VHGSVLGAGVVDVESVVVVLVGSELGGAGAGLVAVTGVVVVLVVLVVPELPAAATVGVVDWPSTVASVWVWVRPGGTFGLAFVLPVVASVGLVAGLATALCAVVAVFLGATFLAVCFTTTGWWTTT